MGDGFAEGLAVGQNNGNNAWGAVGEIMEKHYL